MEANQTETTKASNQKWERVVITSISIFSIENEDFKDDYWVVEKTTVDKFGQTSEEFIKYLDTYLKPEINLRENDTPLLAFIQNSSKSW